MPTYEYKCTQDGTTFDVWQEVGAEAPPCPQCGAPTKKVFRPVRTIFKGSGFYLTDTRAEAGVGKEEAPKADASKTDATPASETKSDAGSAPSAKSDAGAAAAS